VLLDVRGLRTYFFLHEGVVRAVDNVSYSIRRGQTIGIIGESGCGKSVTAQSIMRIVPSPPARIVAGEILFRRSGNGGGAGDAGGDGAGQTIDLTKLDPRGDEICAIRGREISMIFQEPMTSFGPMHTIGNQIEEAILLHQQGISGKQAHNMAIELLGKVGIPKPEQRVNAFPHQLSGGMRQRAMIAMALSCRPSLLIADEPTTALDVTIQAQILDLLRQLQSELGMAIQFITHNLGVIAEMASEVVVMYLGRIVEQASVMDIFDNPKHPYTQGLLRSIPRVEQKRPRRLSTIEGAVPDPYRAPRGCAFSDRCPSFMAGVCDQAVPALVPVAPGHNVRCFLYSNKVEETAQTGPTGPTDAGPQTPKRPAPRRSD
jgi:oligopeptide/dipeptide ABC transporter ATP-binding protein